MHARILIADADMTLAEAMAAFLRARGYAVDTVSQIAAAIERVSRTPYDLVFLDLRLGDGKGLDAYRRIQAAGFSEPVVMISGSGTSDEAVEAMRLGAADLLRKPFNLSEVEILVRRLIEQEQRRRELEHLRVAATGAADGDVIVGSDPEFERLLKDVGDVAESLASLAPGDCPPVYITGETGVGKNLIAGRLHLLIAGREHPFVRVGCTSTHRSLFEAELFGDERGAPGETHRSRQGLFEAASGGTLFLDDIGRLPLDLQATLLAAIEEKQIRRAGSSERRPVDVRIITSTNADIASLVSVGLFRSDLFYRISTIELRVPPLRQRPGDIVPIAQHYLAIFAAKYGRSAPKQLEPGAMELLRAYRWPGNIRELRNLMERIALRSERARIAAADLLRVEPGLGEGDSGVQGQAATAGIIDDILEGQTYTVIERRLLQHALDQSGGNISAAARRLGMTREKFRSRWRVTHRGLEGAPPDDK